MRIIVPHNKTRQEVVRAIDRGSDELFAGVGGAPIEIVDKVKAWNGSVMSFSFTGQMGFISVPLSGTVEVDDRNVTIDCELPGMVRNFIGEDKIRPAIEKKVKGLIA